MRVKHQLPCRSKDEDLLAKSLQNTFNLPTQNTPRTEVIQTNQLFSAYSCQYGQNATPKRFSLPLANYPIPYLTSPKFSTPQPNLVTNPVTPSIDWNSLINIMNTVKKKEEEHKKPVAEQATVKTEPDTYDLLTEDEVVQLIKNFKDLEEDERKDFLGYMKRLENINPEKVKRLKRKVLAK